MYNSQYTPEFRRSFWLRTIWCDVCLVWTGYVDRHGYGRLGVNGRSTLAHRVAYELVYGPIPDGLDILHGCDNAPCCNPIHLTAGTHIDNMRDCSSKQRNVFGERHPKARLTDALVQEIRQRYVPGVYSTRRISRDYGIPRNTARQVVTRTTWKHI